MEIITDSFCRKRVRHRFESHSGLYHKSRSPAQKCSNLQI